MPAPIRLEIFRIFLHDRAEFDLVISIVIEVKIGKSRSKNI